MKNNIMAGLMLAMFIHSAEADNADKGGNGGDAVVCGASVRLLDAVEGAKLRMDLAIPGETLLEKVALLVQRFRTLEGRTSERVQKSADELLFDLGLPEEEMTKVEFTNDVLSDVPDSLELSLPEGCEKRQLIVRQDRLLPGEKEYTINRKLWNAMDLNNQAMAILHESIFKALDRSPDSRLARYINEVLASRIGETISPIEFALEISKRARKFYGNVRAFSLYGLTGIVRENVLVLDDFDSRTFPNRDGCKVVDSAESITMSRDCVFNPNGIYVKSKFGFWPIGWAGLIIWNKHTRKYSVTNAEISSNNTFRFTNATLSFEDCDICSIRGDLAEDGTIREIFGKFAQVRMDNGRVFKDLTVLPVDDLGNITLSNGDIKEDNAALLVAASNGDTKTVKRLLNSGAEVNSQDENGNTPAIFASIYGHAETLALLIKNGADLCVENKLGQTALNVSRFGSEIYFQLLWAKAAYGCVKEP